MEWSGRPLTEELCVAILRHLEPRHLAAVSACSSTARRAAASDALWEPLFVAEHEEKRAAARPRQRGAAAAAGTSSGAPPLSDEQRQRRRNAVAVGVFKEKYRKGRADELRQQVWTARQKAASAEAAHSNSLQNCEELDRAVHRLRGAVASEQRAKRQRLAHGGWHPSAVSRQFTGGGADFDLGAAKAVAAASGADGPTAAEQTLRKFEAQSTERRATKPPYQYLVIISRRYLLFVVRSRVSVWVSVWVGARREDCRQAIAEAGEATGGTRSAGSEVGTQPTYAQRQVAPDRTNLDLWAWPLITRHSDATDGLCGSSLCRSPRCARHS